MSRSKKFYAGIAALAVLSIAGSTLAYRYITGPDQLQRVVDGDTLVINRITHVRLWGIDAPELEQTCIRDNGSLKVRWDCGRVAKGYLQSFFKAHVDLKCEKRGQESYGRMVAICYAINVRGERHDIARSLVAAGYALDYPQYSHGYYQAEQDYAERHKLGVWSGEFEKPWDWRHNRIKP